MSNTEAVKIGRMAVVKSDEIVITAPANRIKVDGETPVFCKVKLSAVQRLTLKSALKEENEMVDFEIAKVGPEGESYTHVWSGAVFKRCTFKTMRLLIERGMVELVHRAPYYVTRSGRTPKTISADLIERYYHVVRFTDVGRAFAGAL